jgi:hypothetical protein
MAAHRFIDSALIARFYRGSSAARWEVPMDD